MQCTNQRLLLESTEQSSLPSTLLKKTGRRKLLAFQDRVLPPPIRLLDILAEDNERDYNYHEFSSVSTQSTPYSQEYYDRRERMPTVVEAVKANNTGRPKKDKIADRVSLSASRRHRNSTIHHQHQRQPHQHRDQNSSGVYEKNVAAAHNNKNNKSRRPPSPERRSSTRQAQLLQKRKPPKPDGVSAASAFLKISNHHHHDQMLQHQKQRQDKKVASTTKEDKMLLQQQQQRQVVDDADDGVAFFAASVATPESPTRNAATASASFEPTRHHHNQNHHRGSDETSLCSREEEIKSAAVTAANRSNSSRDRHRSMTATTADEADDARDDDDNEDYGRMDASADAAAAAASAAAAAAPFDKKSSNINTNPRSHHSAVVPTMTAATTGNSGTGGLSRGSHQATAKKNGNEHELVGVAVVMRGSGGGSSSSEASKSTARARGDRGHIESDICCREEEEKETTANSSTTGTTASRLAGAPSSYYEASVTTLSSKNSSRRYHEDTSFCSWEKEIIRAAAINSRGRSPKSAAGNTATTAAAASRLLSAARRDNDNDAASLCSRENEILSAAASRKTGRSSLPTRDQLHRTMKVERHKKSLSWMMNNNDEHFTSGQTINSNSNSNEKSGAIDRTINEDFLESLEGSLDSQQPTKGVSFDDFLTASSCSSISASLDPSGYTVTQNRTAVTDVRVVNLYNSNYNTITRPGPIRYDRVKSVLDRIRKPVVHGTAVSGALPRRRGIITVSARSVQGGELGGDVRDTPPPPPQTLNQYCNNNNELTSTASSCLPVFVGAEDLVKYGSTASPRQEAVEVESAKGVIVVTAGSCLEGDANHDGERVDHFKNGSDAELEQSNSRKDRQDLPQGRDPPAYTACTQDVFPEKKQARDLDESHEIHSLQRSVAKSESTERIFSEHYTPLGRILCGPTDNPSTTKGSWRSSHV